VGPDEGSHAVPGRPPSAFPSLGGRRMNTGNPRETLVRQFDRDFLTAHP
jgi:hypothetical protein